MKKNDKARSKAIKPPKHWSELTPAAPTTELLLLRTTRLVEMLTDALRWAETEVPEKSFTRRKIDKLRSSYVEAMRVDEEMDRRSLQGITGLTKEM